MLTLSTLATEQLLRGDLRPVYRVDIGATFGSWAAHDAGWIATFISQASSRNFFGESGIGGVVPDLLLGLSSISQRLDISSGGYSTGTMSVELEDHPEVRDLVADNRLIGKDLIVYLGFDHDDWRYTDWIPVFRGVITAQGWQANLTLEAAPFDAAHMPTTGAVRQESASIPTYTGVGLSANTQSGWDHFTSLANPLTCIEDLLTVAQVPARFIDSTSLDPSEADNDTLAHLRVHLESGIITDRRISNETSIWDMAQKIAFLCRGFLRFNEEGEAVFTRFQPAAAVSVATWAIDEDISEELEDVKVTENDIITSVKLQTGAIGERELGPNFGVWVEDLGQHLVHLEAEADTAQDWGYQPDNDNPYRQMEISDEYFGANGVNVTAFNAATPAVAFEAFIGGANPNPDGLNVPMTSGNGFGWPGIGTDVEAISADRPLYLAIVHVDSGEFSVIKYTGCTLLNDPADPPLPRVQCTGGTFVAGSATLAEATDFQLNVVDVSACWPFIEWLLTIFGNSAARVQVKTLPHTYPVQVGDMVQLDTDRYVDYGSDGDPGAAKFLVMSKEVNWEDLSISWELMRVRTGTLISSYSDVTPMVNPLDTKNPGYTDPETTFGLADWDDDSGMENAVLEGCIGGVDATLTHTISAGWYGMSRWRHYNQEFERTYTDDKDTWCYVGEGARELGAYARWDWTEVANGAPRPATPTGFMPVMRVRTEAGAITEVLDLRNRGFAGTRTLRQRERYTLAGSESMGDAIISGFDMAVPGGGGLVGTVPAGVVLNAGVRVERKQDEDHTFTASRYTFVDIDADGDAHFVEMALAGAVEVLPASGRVRVLVVTTDATDITAVARYPLAQRQFSRAVSPGAIRDGQTPNPLFDDYDPASGTCRAWEVTEAAGTTITATGEGVKSGRWGYLANLGVGARTGYLHGDALAGIFQINPNILYSGSVFYSSGSAARTPSMYIGLEFFDRQMVSLGVRNFIANGRSPALDATDEGGVEDGTFIGAGAGQTQIPPTARWARWVLRFDANVGGASAIYISGVRLDAGASGGGGTNLLHRHPYVLTVGTNQQYPTPEEAGTAAQLLTLSATQRCKIEIYPGAYTLTAELPADEFIDWEGVGDSPGQVQLTSATDTDAFQDAGSGDWSIRNLTIIADGTGWCVDANAGGGGTLEDVVMEGDTGGVLRTTTDLEIEGHVTLRAGASTTDLINASGCNITGHGVLELDDTADSGAGINLTSSGTCWVRLAHLDAHGDASGDCIYSDHAGNIIDIKDGRITGWDDGIHAADTVVMRFGPLVIGGTNTYDINAVGTKCVLLSTGASYSLAKVGTPGNLTTYGPTEDQNSTTQRRCYLYDSAGGIAVGTGAWVDITWATEVVKNASWSHAANSAEIELLENAVAGITIHYDLAVYNADASPVKMETRIMRSTGGASYVEVAGSRDYITIAGEGIDSLHRTLVIPSQVDGDKYKLQAMSSAIVTATTVADHSGITLRRDY